MPLDVGRYAALASEQEDLRGTLKRLSHQLHQADWTDRDAEVSGPYSAGAAAEHEGGAESSAADYVHPQSGR